MENRHQKNSFFSSLLDQMTSAIIKVSMSDWIFIDKGN